MRSTNTNTNTNTNTDTDTDGNESNTKTESNTNNTNINTNNTNTKPSPRKLCLRINVVIVCAMIALTMQLVNLRQFGFANDCGDLLRNEHTTNDMDAPSVATTTTTTTANGEALPAAEAVVPVGGTTTPPNTHPNGVPLPRFTHEPVVIMVLSRRTAPEVRQAIRTTWAKGRDNVYFVVGTDCPIHPTYRGVDEGGNSMCQVAPRVLTHDYFQETLDHMENVKRQDDLLRQEQAHYQDLIVMPDVDVYRTLPQKLKYAYTFVEDHLSPSTTSSSTSSTTSSGAKWIVKVDDDFFVRVDEISNFLLTTYDSTQPILVGGDIRYNHGAHTSGKWKEVPQFPLGAHYPPFPLGSYGHAVTRSITRFVATHQAALFDYQGEDVSIGIWLDAPTAPKVTFQSTTHLQNNGDCSTPHHYVVGHDVTPSKMKTCQDHHQQQKH
jgi:hypothetical protein